MSGHRRPIERIVVNDQLVLQGDELTADISHDVATGLLHVALVANKVEVVYRDQATGEKP